MPSDFIPDIPKRTASANNGASGGTSISGLKAQWLSEWNSPATIEDIRDWMKRADKIHWQIIDKVAEQQDRYPGKDTPEERGFLEAYKRLDDAVKGLDVLVNSGYKDIVWNASEERYQKIQGVGAQYFDAASKWISSKSASVAEKLNIPKLKDDSSWGFWKGAIAVTLGIVAVSQFTELVHTLKPKRD